MDVGKIYILTLKFLGPNNIFVDCRCQTSLLKMYKYILWALVINYFPFGTTYFFFNVGVYPSKSCAAMQCVFTQYYVKFNKAPFLKISRSIGNFHIVHTYTFFLAHYVLEFYCLCIHISGYATDNHRKNTFQFKPQRSWKVTNGIHICK